MSERDVIDGCAVVILTFNEERNIAAAIESVLGWAQEIFVVDAFSTDRTVDLALGWRDAGVHVCQHTFVDYGQQWAWAMSTLPIRARWTLKLDADERATDAFRSEADELMDTVGPEVEGIYFRRQLHFLGKQLRWGGLRENHDLRMWRSGCVRFEDRSVNEHACVKGASVKMQAAVEHHDAKSLSHWLDRHNRYSSMEAVELLHGNLLGDHGARFWGSPIERRMWLRRLFHRLPFRTTLYFLYRVIFRLGILDGRAGIRYASLHASFFYWIQLKVDEAKATGDSPDVLWPARGAPHAALGRGSTWAKPNPVRAGR